MSDKQFRVTIKKDGTVTVRVLACPGPACEVKLQELLAKLKLPGKPQIEYLPEYAQPAEAETDLTANAVA